MFDGDLKMANSCLTFAFERCLASNKGNKRLILIYLIPVRMLLGILPYNALLQKYKLEEFEGIASAVKIFSAGILKTHLLPVPAFTEALKKMGVDDIDADETECILANLVYEGKIKGYLAHQQQKLVVSKIQPFPSL
ncbi:PCI domain-containing protein 2 [Taenia crassiceps]|uniref:CSN12-like protein n=1 Tax=Taenia crassiceps TaxID=6207 RepID=A0ABR4QR51_9CEST